MLFARIILKKYFSGEYASAIALLVRWPIIPHHGAHGFRSMMGLTNDIADFAIRPSFAVSSFCRYFNGGNGPCDDEKIPMLRLYFRLYFSDDTRAR